MMKKELTLEDSPFYVEYDGKLEQQSFKVPKSFEDALKKHLQDKYADEIKKDGKFRYGKYIRKTIEDYLQHQCLERKMFGKSIYAIVSEDELKNKENPIIDAIFVTNPSLYYTTRPYDKYELLHYQVHKVPIADFPYNLMMWSSKLENKFLKALNEYKEVLSSENILVLEISLNNYLDWYHDGIYSERANPYVHVGANFIGTDIGAFGIYYQWIVNEDYSISVSFIQVCNQESLLYFLRQCGNDEIYARFLTYFKKHNKHFPKLELDILESQLQRKLNLKSDIEDEIAEIQKQIDNLKE